MEARVREGSDKGVTASAASGRPAEKNREHVHFAARGGSGGSAAAEAPQARQASISTSI